MLIGTRDVHGTGSGENQSMVPPRSHADKSIRFQGSHIVISTRDKAPGRYRHVINVTDTQLAGPVGPERIEGHSYLSFEISLYLYFSLFVSLALFGLRDSKVRMKEQINKCSVRLFL